MLNGLITFILILIPATTFAQIPENYRFLDLGGEVLNEPCINSNGVNHRAKMALALGGSGYSFLPFNVEEVPQEKANRIALPVSSKGIHYNIFQLELGENNTLSNTKYDLEMFMDPDNLSDGFKITAACSSSLPKSEFAACSG
jgi:hypothetical protein